jgi:hypothetical protein
MYMCFIDKRRQRVPKRARCHSACIESYSLDLNPLWVIAIIFTYIHVGIPITCIHLQHVQHACMLQISKRMPLVKKLIATNTYREATVKNPYRRTDHPRREQRLNQYIYANITCSQLDLRSHISLRLLLALLSLPSPTARETSSKGFVD